MKRNFYHLVFQIIIICSIVSSSSWTSFNTSGSTFNSQSAVLVDDLRTCYLFNVSGCYAVQATEPDLGVVRLYAHLPISYGRQAPIVLYLWEYPTGKVLDYKLNQDYPGSNFLLEIVFSDLEEMEIVYVFWSMLILMEHNDYSHLPEVIEMTPVENLPSESKIWLESTDFVQSTHPEIIAKAEELAGNETNALAVAKNIGNFTGLEIDYQYTDEPQDALTTLHNGFGVCTGKSTLAIALLRALDIPARMVLTSPLPHFLVECYLHPYGWIRFEATPGTIPFDYHWLTIGYYAYPSDESNTSVINGQHPEEGFIAYWGTDNPLVAWGYIGTHCKRETNTLEMSSEQLEQAYNISNLVWDQFFTNFNSELTDREQARYEEALSLQTEAINSYIDHNIVDFLDYMEIAFETYLSDITPTETANSGFYSIVLGVSLIVFQTVNYRRKREMK